MLLTASKSDVSDDIITVNRERLGRAGSSSPEELADFDEVYRECGDVGEMPGKVNEENTNPATMDYALQGELKLARVVEGPQQSRPDSSPPQPQPEPQSQDQQLQQRKVKSVKSRRLYTPIEDNRSILAQQSWGIGSMTAEPSRTHIFVKSEKDNRVQSVDVDSVQCNNATAGPIGTGSKSQRAPTDTQRNRFISSLSDIAAPSRTNSAQLGAKRAQLILQPRNASIGGMGGGLGLSFFENNIAPPGGERQRKQLSKKSNPLDQQRARIEEVLDDGQNGSLSTVASSIGKESTIQLWRELQVLDALISIRDSILEIASSHTLDTKVKRKGSATKNAEDAVSTAQAMWLYVTTIHREAYGQVTDADRVLRVARLVKLALESAPVATQYWTGRAAIEKKIESILGMTEKYGATARTDALRVASWKFGLLASSQRLALRRTWIDGDPSARSEGAEIEPATLWARARHILLSPSLPSGLSGRRPAKDFIAQLCSYESSSVGQVVPLIAELPSRSPDVINPVPNDEQKKKQASEWQAKVMARFQHQREQFLDNQEYIDSDEEDFTSRRGTETPADTGRRIKYTVDEYLKYGPTPAHKLGRWADETASAHSEGLPEDDAHGFGRGDGVDDQRLSEEAVRDDVVEYDMGDNTMVPRKTDPSANRIEELDIVDDLLAQWTTLPRYAARYGIDINQRT